MRYWTWNNKNNNKCILFGLIYLVKKKKWLLSVHTLYKNVYLHLYLCQHEKKVSSKKSLIACCFSYSFGQLLYGWNHILWISQFNSRVNYFFLILFSTLHYFYSFHFSIVKQMVIFINSNQLDYFSIVFIICWLFSRAFEIFVWIKPEWD